MSREKNIEKVLELMNSLAHPGKHHDHHPWIELKLTREQLRVIFLLSFHQPVSPGEIAGEFGVPKANVTNVINSLVEKEYVKRYENNDDRRSYLLSLTEDGEKQVAKLREFQSVKMKKIVNRIPDKDLNFLVIGFGAFIKALIEEGKESGNNKG